MPEGQTNQEVPDYSLKATLGEPSVRLALGLIVLVLLILPFA